MASRRLMLIGTSCLVSLLAGARGQALAEPAWVPAPAQQVPPRFYVAESVLPRFLDLLQRSPTFRAQCRQIVDAEVRVVIEVGAVWDFASDVRATSAILRDDDGRVRFVRVRIRPEGVVARLLPHEMEHVIEQLEGLDLPRLAAKRDGRVWLVGARSFETRRACAIGTRVEQEYKEYKGPVVSAATPGGAHAAGTW